MFRRLGIVALLILAAMATPAAAQFTPFPGLGQPPIIVVPPPAAPAKTCCHDECTPDTNCRRGAVCPAICIRKCAPCS
jgi:hypothetical protein